ncbi:hypothetical protein V8D89_003468 [Ganoderma adspersum]
MQASGTSRSATSRALTCADIIVEMIKQTALTSDGPLPLYPKHDRPLLSILALVCRAFNGPASKALWSRLDSFLPVLNLLSTFDSSGSPGTTPTYLISGDISPHELSRLRELGGFVRAVVPSPGCICESDSIKPSVWFYLAQISEGRSLFPHLQELHWFIEEPSSTELLLVVPSSLQRLSVCYGGCGTDSREWTLSQSMLFRSVFKAAPHLTHLAIHDTHEALLPACLSNIGVLHKLRVVSLDEDESVNLDVLRTLSSVESLEELSIGVESIDGVDFAGFPAIRKLNVVSTPTSGSSSQVFDAFFSPHLRELSLRIRSIAADTDNLFSTSTIIARRFPFITNLSLTLSSPLRAREGGTSLEAALEPLFPLPVVTFSLNIQLCLTGPLSGVFFTALAHSWPRLRELSIVMLQPRIDGPVALSGTVNAQTLLALAGGCPQLQTLRLPNMMCVQPGDIGGYTVLQHPLRTLAVDSLFGFRDRPSEDEYVECALLLDKFFPELDTRSLPAPGIPLTDTWQRVLSGVRLCQLGRSNRTS